MSDLISITDTPKLGVKFSTQAQKAHVRAWEASGETMSHYCQSHGLSLSAFSGWSNKYSQKKNGEFIGIAPLVKNTTIKKGQSMQIVFGNQVRIIIAEITDLSAIVKLLKELSQCT
jgi:hypothetical protein